MEETVVRLWATENDVPRGPNDVERTPCESFFPRGSNGMGNGAGTRIWEEGFETSAETRNKKVFILTPLYPPLATGWDAKLLARDFSDYSKGTFYSTDMSLLLPLPYGVNNGFTPFKSYVQN